MPKRGRILPGQEAVKALLRRAYRRLASMMTSVYLLGLLALFSSVGTVFSQWGGFDEYVEAGGKAALLVRTLGLLDPFASALFLVLALALALNLGVCAWERLKALRARRCDAGPFEPHRSLLMTQDAAKAHEEARRVARQTLGFRLIDKDGEWTVMEKGLPHRWLTLAYHAGLLACMAGALLTFLFAFEDTMSLKQGSAETVVPGKTGRVQSLWQEAAAQTDFHLVLEDSSTEYAEVPELEYPEDAKSRLAMALGWQMPGYKLSDDALTPTDWRARVRVGRGGSTLVEKELEVNDPLRFGGYTFYLLGFERSLRLRIDGNPIVLEAKADDDAVMIPGVSSTLSFGALRAGMVTRLNGQTEELAPHVAVSRSGSSGTAATLRLGGSIIVDNTVITLAGFTDSALLSYRYDPGVAVLWLGGLLVLVAMCLRFYGPCYLLAYRVDDSGAIVSISLHVTATGLSADRDRLLSRIEHLLTENDLKPPALP